MYDKWIEPILVVIIGLAIFIGGAFVTYKHYKPQIIDLKKSNADLVEWKAASVKQAALDETQRKQLYQDQLDYQRKVQDAEDETAKLRGCIDAGKCGLRVNTIKPLPRMPTSTTPPTGSDASTCRLTADAEQNYYSLRNGIAKQANQINLLQRYVTSILASQKQ